MATTPQVLEERPNCRERLLQEHSTWSESMEDLFLGLERFVCSTPTRKPSSGILKSAGQRSISLWSLFGAAPQLVVCGGGQHGRVGGAASKAAGPACHWRWRPSWDFGGAGVRPGPMLWLCLPCTQVVSCADPRRAGDTFVVVTRAHSCDIACLRSILQSPLPMCKA